MTGGSGIALAGLSLQRRTNPRARRNGPIAPIEREREYLNWLNRGYCPE